MGELFTIGYAGHDTSDFGQLLGNYDIDYVLDVRSTPYSRYAPQFNRTELERVLRSVRITYCYMGQFLGARPTDLSLYDQDGLADFEKLRNTVQFQRGIQSVIRGLNDGHRITLMCAERDPWDCHRAILVTRALALHDIEAKHILADGQLLPQSALDTILVDKYFPSAQQLSLFSGPIFHEDWRTAVADAYRRRASEIACHMSDARSKKTLPR